MPLTLDVSLMSGKTVSLETHGDESVESLRMRAQRALRAGKGRLFNSAGSVPGFLLRNLRYHNKEPMWFTIDPNYGN